MARTTTITTVSKTTCPRCGGRMPKGRAALSRADNRTVVCAKCGRDEGMIAYFGGTLPPVEDWPIKFSF